MLLTVILIIRGLVVVHHPHSFILETLQILPTAPFTVTSEHIRFYFLVSLFYTF